MLNIGERTRTQTLTVEYCSLRYKQELELKELKESLKLELTEKFNKTEDISRQKIEFVRAAYEKLINTRFSIDNIDSVKNTEEMAMYIYKHLVEYFSKNTNVNKDYYSYFYKNNKLEIINYYKTYFDNIIKIKEFKEAQFQELRIISKQLIEDKSPIYLVENIYKRLKSDLHILRHDSSELQYCRDEYDYLKDELINQIQQINKEFK